METRLAEADGELAEANDELAQVDEKNEQYYSSVLLADNSWATYGVQHVFVDSGSANVLNMKNYAEKGYTI